MTGCYNELQQSLLHRIRASHAGMRRYYGSLRAVALSSYMALALVIAGHNPAHAQSAAIQAAPDQTAPDQTASDQSDAERPAADWAGQTGAASFYGKAHQGRRTASGKRFDDKAMTAAHPWLPFGTKVLVTVEGTGRAVIVTITDRLPSRRRIIDLSREAAMKLGIIRQGIAYVSLSPG
jgi:rare lipoprotein A